MFVRHHHANLVYIIEVPPGSRVRRSEATGESVVYIPWDGGEVPIFEEPGDLLVQLARAGQYGLLIAGVEDLSVP